MSKSEKYTSPQVSSSKIGDTSTANTSTTSEPIEAFIAPIVTAQFAFFELMLNCTLALVNEPVSHAAAESPQKEREQWKEYWESGFTDYMEAATTLGAGWLAAPMITGIDETLNDQFFKPRPGKIQERDILALKEPSSEFEASHVTAEAQASEIHSEAA
jgi:hypothetical protein